MFDFKLIKKIYSYILRYRFFFLLAIFLGVIHAMIVSSLPILTRNIVNYVTEGSFDLALNIVLIWLIAKVVQLLVWTASFYAFDKAMFKALADVRTDVFKHIQDLDFAYHTNKSSGSLISMFKRGEGGLFDLYAQLTFDILQITLDFIFMTIIFANLYPSMVWIAVVTFFVNTLVLYRLVKNNIDKRNEFNKIEDSVTATVVDNMIAFDTVKYFGNETYEQNRLRGYLDTWVKVGYDYGMSFRIIDLTCGTISITGSFLILIVALNDLSLGHITIGDFVMVSAFVAVFFPSLIKLVFSFRNIAKNFEDLRKYISVLDEPIVVKDKIKPDSLKIWENFDKGKALDINFKNIVFAYEKGRRVLEGIDLKIKAGESVAFVGKSGAGKTTLVKLLMRLYDPNSGDIEIGGISIKDIPKQTLRKSIGIVPQETLLFNNTIGYNLAYGKDEFTLEELEEAAKMANFLDFIKSLPDKWNTMVGERGIKLSGGQKQRLAIARVFMENAPIIVFDEATSNLDSESEGLIQDAFWNISKDKTTIVIAHRLSTIKKVDRIIVIDDGKIAEIGTHKELMSKSSGIYKYLISLQNQGEIVS